MQVHLKTLGCRLNEAELETWARAFQRAGHRITQEIEASDLVVINSCAVTQDAVRKSRHLIRRVHRDNPRAKLVVSGCYATLNPDEAASLLGVDLVVGNGDKEQLVAKALSNLTSETMPAMATEPGETSLFARGRQRAFVKVQDGCRYRCTFCIVTVARGEERSRSIAEVIEEITELNRQGIDEVVLTGVHLGGYGSDTGQHLTGLIKAVLADTDIKRLRLGSLEPWELTDDFFELFANPRVMPHLHLPLQSGSDTVLRRMARRCKTDEFTQIVESLRASVPDFNVTTDVIVGFPGESETEWLESLEFIKNIGFGHIHIFTYSPRAGTKAATLPNPVAESVKKERSRQLHALADELRLQFVHQNLGRTFPVLWEGYSEDVGGGLKRVFGYTPNYLKVGCLIDVSVIVENRILPTALTAAGRLYVHSKLLTR